MCVSYEMTKGKFPGEHHMICGEETKFISLINWAISTKLLEMRDKEMYLENCLLLFHSCEKTGLNA